MSTTVEACIPIRVVLVALSAGNILVLRKDTGIVLPETWLKRDESLCSAAARLAREIAGSTKSLRIVSVVWFDEVAKPFYHIVFAVEGFIESRINLPDNAVFVRIEEASRLLSDEAHRKLIETLVVFKPRPLLVCS